MERILDIAKYLTKKYKNKKKKNYQKFNKKFNKM